MKLKNEISNTVLLVIKEYKVTVDFVRLKRIDKSLARLKERYQKPSLS